MLAARTAEADHKPRQGTPPSSPDTTHKRRTSGSRREEETRSPPPLQPSVAPTDLPDEANAAQETPRRSRADKRNRRCAVFENTIIAAAEHSPPGDEAAEDHGAARLGSAVVASQVAILVTTQNVDGDAVAADRRRSSPSSSELLDGSGGQDAASVLYALADGFYETSPGEDGDEEEQEGDVLIPTSFLAPPPVADIDVGPGDAPYEELETSLDVDLAIANETNEASLPKLRKLTRRKSSLRNASDLDPGGKDEPAALWFAPPPEEGATSPPVPQESPLTDSEGTWASSPDEAPSRASAGDASAPFASTQIGAEAAPVPASVSIPHTALDEETRPQKRLSAIFECPDTAADEENVAMGDEEASGAAVALKRRLSLRFSAMSEYNPEMDFNNKALRHDDSTQAGGRALRRGSGRFRERAESVKRLTRPRGESPAVSPKSQEVDGERPLSSDERRSPHESAAESAESPMPGFGETGWNVHEHRRTRSYSASATAKVNELGPAGVLVRTGGTLTETVIGPDGRLIVLGSSAPPRLRRASADSGGLASNLGTTNSTAPLQDGWRTSLTAAERPDETYGDAAGKVDPQRPPADSRAGIETIPEEVSPRPPAGETSSPTEPPSASSAGDLEIDPAKDPAAAGKSQRTHQDAEPAAPRPQLAPKPKRSSPWSWLFGDGDSGSQRKQATSPGQSPTKSSSPAVPDSPAGDARVPNGSPSPPAEAESAAAAAPAPSSRRFPPHVERAIYRLSHSKLANARRPLVQQVLVSNMMLWYLALVARRQQQQQLLAERQQLLQQQQQQFFDDDSCSDSDSDEEPERERRRKKAQKKAEKERARKAEKSAKKKWKDARS